MQTKGFFLLPFFPLRAGRTMDPQDKFLTEFQVGISNAHNSSSSYTMNIWRWKRNTKSKSEVRKLENV